jgi:hypothetical protein
MEKHVLLGTRAEEQRDEDPFCFSGLSTRAKVEKKGEFFKG